MSNNNKETHSYVDPFLNYILADNNALENISNRKTTKMTETSYGKTTIVDLDSEETELALRDAQDGSTEHGIKVNDLFGVVAYWKENIDYSWIKGGLATVILDGREYSTFCTADTFTKARKTAFKRLIRAIDNRSVLVKDHFLHLVPLAS